MNALLTGRPRVTAFTSVLAAVLLALASSAPAQVDGQLRWAFSTLSSTTAGSILSSPAQAEDGTLYIGVQVGSATSAVTSGRLLAIRADGTLQGSFTAPDWIDSTPALGSDGTIYVGCWDGKIYALNPDLTMRWSFATGGFIASSAAIGHDGTVYIGSGDGNVYALTADGALRWSFPTSDWVDSSPALGPDGTVYVGSWDTQLYAIAPDGRLRWQAATADAIVASPCVGADGSITVGSRDGYLYSFSRDGGLRWRADLGEVIEGSPVLGPTGMIHVATTEGRVFAIRSDGTEAWRYPRAGQAALQPIYSTPAVRRDGSVIVATADRALVALRPDGTVLWSTAVGDWLDSSPLIGRDGTLYVGCTDKRLYAVAGTQLPLLGEWPQHRRDSQRNALQVIGRLAGTPGRLVNLSTRALTGAGENTLIAGFVVKGDGARSVLVRGVGPTLQPLGVPSPLADPRLTVYRGPTVIATNDNWGAAPNATTIALTMPAVGAFALPELSLDASVLQSFGASEYTAHVTGAAGTTGVALLELYDAGGDNATRLINISARSRAGTGNDVLIVGFAIRGGSRAVLIRGAGPVLLPYVGAAALANPLLRLYRGQQLIAENDDWGASGIAAQVVAVSAPVAGLTFATGSLDSALLVTLPEGQYTAHVLGVSAGTGVALAELYEIQ